MSAAFSPELLDEQLNSEIIEVGDRHVVVIRVLEHEDERDKTLDDVRDQVTEELKSERANEMLTLRQETALEKLAAGETPSAIAEGDEFATTLEGVVLERQSAELDGRVVSRVFALPHPDAEKVVTEEVQTSNGDLMALRLMAVEVPALAEDASESAEADPVAVSAGANPQLGNTEFEALLESLRESADVEVTATASP